MDKLNLIVINYCLQDIQLQKNFLLSEFFTTNKGFPHNVEMPMEHQLVLLNIINNNSSFYLSKNLLRLAEFLQSFRDEFNEKIFITSGYRTVNLNNAVNGASNSYHLIGLAADISFNGYKFYMNCPKNRHTPSKIVSMCDWLRLAKSKGILKELIFHDNYIHLALSNYEKST